MKHKHRWQFSKLDYNDGKWLSTLQNIMFVCECGKYKWVKAIKEEKGE